MGGGTYFSKNLPWVPLSLMTTYRMIHLAGHWIIPLKSLVVIAKLPLIAFLQPKLIKCGVSLPNDEKNEWLAAGVLRILSRIKKLVLSKNKLDMPIYYAANMRKLQIYLAGYFLLP
jgi:hypothetical protein